MYQVIAVHPAGDERVVNTFNDWVAATEYAEALQADEVWYMYYAREAE
jgi:hypothetical protein